MGTDHPAATSPDRDRVLPVTRVLAGLIVPVLVAAFIMLYLLPHDTERLFAWPVRPPMTSMMLGATYLGGAYFFARVLSARRWHHVSLGLLPVAALCLILGAATALHWDRFTHGHISFVLWVILYFSLPVVLPLAWHHNQRAARATGTKAVSVTLSRHAASAFGSLGAAFTGVGLLLFLVPDRIIPTWPWELTPLTARVVSAMFVLTGLIGLSIAADRRWAAVRLILQAQALAVVLILAAIVLARRDFDWSAPTSWSFVAGLLAVFALVVTVLLRYRGRELEHEVAEPPLETAGGG
jgi:uncharacterized membrane protein